MLCNVDKPVYIYIYLTVQWWYIYISVTSNCYFGRLEAATFVCLAIAVLLWILVCLAIAVLLWIRIFFCQNRNCLSCLRFDQKNYLQNKYILTAVITNYGS